MTIPALFQTDAYKLGHIKMYPEGIQEIYSNFTNRGSRLEGVNHVVNFGLQAFIQKYLVDDFEEFFMLPEDEVVNEYQTMLDGVFGPGQVNSDHVRALHQLRYVPLKVKALPEGALVPIGVPMLTIKNTHPDFAWLTNYVESVLSASLWQPSTSATKAWQTRQMLNRYAEMTGMPAEATDFQMHDFSLRGQSSIESAAASGAAHLLSSYGSDTIPAISYINNYYPTDEFILGSVPASEHSVMTSYVDVLFDENGARQEVDESDTYRELMTRFPDGILSIVSDTYDFFGVLRMFEKDAGNGLYDMLMARNGKVVFRPDSGDPDYVINGDPNAPEGSDASKGALSVLWEIFGGTVNDKEFKVLDEHVGLIYGDGMYYERIEKIIRNGFVNGFASQVVFGIGSYTYQMVSRDVFYSAVKATSVVIDGKRRAIMKDPKEDSKKRSAMGLLKVEMVDNEYVLRDNVSEEEEQLGELLPVFWDGSYVEYSFDQVRKNLKEHTERIA